MRQNLKRVLTSIVLLAMLITLLITPAQVGAFTSDAQKCVILNLLKGDAGVTDAYLAKTSTRLQSAIISLRLSGLESRALTFKGSATFTDAGKVNWEGGRNILAYLKENPQLGWVGSPDGSFKPNDKIDAQAMHKVLLEVLGYKQGVDFTWGNVTSFARSHGFSKTLSASTFTNTNIASAMLEALNQKLNGSGIQLIQKLVTSRMIAEENAKRAGFSVLPASKVTLVMWGGVPPESGPQKACDNFNKEFAKLGIKIEYERFVNDQNGNLKLETNLLAGNDIDLYMTYAKANIAKRATGKMALQLDDLLKRDNINLVDSLGELAKFFMVDGKNYSIPTTNSQNGYLLNMDMFNAAGIPIPKSWTLDEFRNIAKKLTKGEGQDKIYGSYLNTLQDPIFPTIYVAASVGNDFYFKPGGKETRFDDPLFEKSYQAVVDMMHVDKSIPTHADSVAQKLTPEGLFLTGKVAMVPGVHLIRNVKDRANFPHTFKTALAPSPMVEKGKYHSAGSLGDFLTINPKSENIEEAWTFVKWYSEKGMAPLAAGGRIPANKIFNPDDIFKEALTGAEDLIDRRSFYEIMIKPAEGYALKIISDNLAEITKVLAEESEAIYLGKNTVKNGLAIAKKRADEIINKK